MRPLDRVGDLAQQRGQPLHRGGLAVCGGQVFLARDDTQIIIHHRSRLRDDLPPAGRVLQGQLVRVQAIRQGRDAQLRLEPALLAHQAGRADDGLPLAFERLPRRLQAAQGGLLARGVRVQRQGDVAAVALDLAHLRLGQRGAHPRDDVRHADLVRADDIHVALDEHGQVCIADGLAGHVQPEQHAALVEERRLRRVHVLGRGMRGVLPQDARAEADHPALHIADRDHEAAAEAVVVPHPVIALDQQPGFLDLLGPVALVEQPRLERIPAIERVAQLPGFPGLLRQAAPLKIIAGNGGLRMAHEQVVIVAGRVGQDRAQPFQPAGVALRGRAALLQLHPGLCGQQRQRLPEVQVLALHHKREDVAAGAASAETMPALGFGKHDKGGGLLVVERTKALVVTSRLLKLDIGRDHVDDVEATLDFFDDAHG
ncbi:MAG: hypothetical protein BWY52_03298 [Chloroflexi bacterium ADurb.Bin325]|nr:MAG: hypothetical protein BWY52_03298 [Chloroflexi bacterium ADurb.Bin325]